MVSIKTLGILISFVTCLIQKKKAAIAVSIALSLFAVGGTYWVREDLIQRNNALRDGILINNKVIVQKLADNTKRLRKAEIENIKIISNMDRFSAAILRAEKAVDTLKDRIWEIGSRSYTLKKEKLIPNL